MRAAPLLHSDCDLDHGGSGSINLTRDKKSGKLLIRAIFTSFPTQARNHWKYAEFLPDGSGKANLAQSVILFPQIQEQIDMLMGKP
jgi:hypothetical protein